MKPGGLSEIVGIHCAILASRESVEETDCAFTKGIYDEDAPVTRATLF